MPEVHGVAHVTPDHIVVRLSSNTMPAAPAIRCSNPGGDHTGFTQWGHLDGEDWVTTISRDTFPAPIGLDSIVNPAFSAFASALQQSTGITFVFNPDSPPPGLTVELASKEVEQDIYELSNVPISV